jgi:hypothetical protein
MSDLADREQESAAAVIGAGGCFANKRALRSSRPASALPACACGGKPVFAPHPPLHKGGPLLEVLKCVVCGCHVGPYSSRSKLSDSWRDPNARKAV